MDSFGTVIENTIIISSIKKENEKNIEKCNQTTEAQMKYVFY